MSTEPTAPAATATPRTPFWVMLLVMALAFVISGIVLFGIFRQQIRVNQQLHAELVTLAKRIKGLEGAQRFGTAQEKTDKAFAELHDTIAAREAQIEELTQRIAALEKTTTAPAAVVEITPPPAGNTETLAQFLALKQAMEAGEPFAAPLAPLVNLPALQSLLPDLKATAEQGLTSEAALRAQLLPLLAVPETPADADMNAVNKRFGGLLHISRKPAVDPYAALRAQAENGATLDVLLHAVDGLSEEARAPLAEWYKAADRRQSLLAKLRAAETAITKPAA